jgi:hypothetical protein
MRCFYRLVALARRLESCYGYGRRPHGAQKHGTIRWTCLYYSHRVLVHTDSKIYLLLSSKG